MADAHLSEDEAILYLLGELPASRRAEFEARLAESVELRDLVRELEEGSVALSLGSPPRRPPPQVWTNIEQVLRRDNRRETTRSAFGMGWWRNGWAVAVASVVGWVLYAVFVNVHHVSPTVAPRETTIATAAPEPENVVSKPPLSAASNVDTRLLRVRTEELSDLRLKIAQLENTTGQLSQLIVQQRTLLGESNRIKFFQLSPASAAGSEAVTAQLSPAQQRAVYLSLGLELGWLPAEAKPRVGTPAGGHATVNSVGGVDFVDLRPTKSEVGNPSPTPQTPPATSAQTPAQPGTESQPSDAAPAIPAFVSGDKLIVALDPSMVPPNSSLSFSANGSPLGTADGSFVMGNNPLVVTIPFSVGSAYAGGLYLTIGTTSYLGQSNTTQFFVPANP